LKKSPLEKIITFLILIIFSPLIIFALICASIITLFSIPKSKKNYKISAYFNDIGSPYYLGIEKSKEYKFYNSAKARMLPIKYIKQKSNGFEYFIFDNTAYIFPNFTKLSFSEENCIWQTYWDGYSSELEKEYQIMLKQFDAPMEIPVKFLIERTIIDVPNIEGLTLPDCVYLTQNYEYAFKNDDIRLLSRLPQTSEELYEMMLLTPDIVGSFKLSNGSIHWHITKEIYAEITADSRDGYFCVSKKTFDTWEENITHWHPTPDDIYYDVCQIGLQGHILVVQNDSILYMGNKNSCPYNQDNAKARNIRFYSIEE